MSIAAYVAGIATYLPGEPIDNDEMERLLGMVGGKPSRTRRVVLRSNGITSRHYAINPVSLLPTHTNAALAAEAVRKLENERFSLQDMQCLVSGTSMPDQLMPGHGVMVHGELGSPPCEVVSVSGVCVSGMASVRYAQLAVCSGTHENAVATASELASAVMRRETFDGEYDHNTTSSKSSPSIGFDKDFLRWMLSDGAGAMLLERRPVEGTLSLKVEWIEIRSYANEVEACMFAGAEKVNGKLVGWLRYDHNELSARSIMAVKQDIKLLEGLITRYTVEKPLPGIARKHDLRPEQIDWFVPHYSSEYFRQRLYDSLLSINFEIPYSKWYTNLKDKGNTGSASIYIMLDGLIKSGVLRSGQRILCYVPESGRFSTSFMLLQVV